MRTITRLRDDAAGAYNAQAEQWAERLRAGNNPAHRFLEKPAMLAKLPDLGGKRVFCIGCGSGEEILLLRSRGASSIYAIDVSEALLEIARAGHPDVEFAMRSMEERQPFDDGTFDFVYSSLTLHYAVDWSGILREVARLLRPGGRMLFSTHHPVKWGAQVSRGEERDTFLMGYERPKGQMPVVYGDYLGTRKIADRWFGTMDVESWHRPLPSILRDVVASGLLLVDFIEPMPTGEARTENPAFFEIHSRVPLFMILELQKPGGEGGK